MRNNSKRTLLRQLHKTIMALENSDEEYFLYNSELDYRLKRIESKIDELNEKSISPCILSTNEDSLNNLITGINNNFKEDTKNIFSWLKGAKKLIICDPYFYSFDKPKKYFKTRENYQEFQKELLPNGLKELDIFHFEGPNKQIFNKFSDYCKSKKIRLRNYSTGAVHDRVLIKDNNTAKMLGTSFGGLGNKIAFFVDLPQEDVELFKNELHKIRHNT